MALFVLQNNSFDRIGRLIAPCLDYCHARGMPFVDWSLTADLDVNSLSLDESRGMIVYGSVGWAKRFKSSRYSRWIDYDERAFAASTWAPILGHAAFNGNGAEMDADEVALRLAADGSRLHVRPDRDDKAFAGGVFDAEGWGRMIADRTALTGKDMSTVACWASEPRRIDAEIRCWFVDGTLVEASYYRRDGAMHLARVTDSGILTGIASLADLYLPSGNCVLDVAIAEAEMAVLEFNPIHCSGWYAADVGRVLDAWTDAVAPSMRNGSAIHHRI